jgi:hypothetical protein
VTKKIKALSLFPSLGTADECIDIDQSALSTQLWWRLKLSRSQSHKRLYADLGEDDRSVMNTTLKTQQDIYIIINIMINRLIDQSRSADPPILGDTYRNRQGLIHLRSPSDLDPSIDRSMNREIKRSIDLSSSLSDDWKHNHKLDWDLPFSCMVCTSALRMNWMIG